jgi:hypothetical protein
MNIQVLLSQAKTEGILLVLEEGRLTWEADHQPPAELLEAIRSHRLEVIEALATLKNLPPRAWEWLAQLASLLGCTAEHLLQHGFVDHHDLAEQYQQHPSLAACLIRTHPYWCKPKCLLRNHEQC